MGDRSPKEAHKKAVQKDIKDNEEEQIKQATTESLHHPTSGHTPTSEHPTSSDEK